MRVLKVHELVDGDVFEDAGREQDRAPVEVEARALAAGAPRYPRSWTVTLVGAAPRRRWWVATSLASQGCARPVYQPIM